jgi:hypothetical protein
MVGLVAALTFLGTLVELEHQDKERQAAHRLVMLRAGAVEELQ